MKIERAMEILEERNELVSDMNIDAKIAYSMAIESLKNQIACKVEEVGIAESTKQIKEEHVMKKYILNQDSTIINKSGEIIISKGAELVDKNNYIDEDGGIKAMVINGKCKGMEIIFSIEELTEV